MTGDDMEVITPGGRRRFGLMTAIGALAAVALAAPPIGWATQAEASTSGHQTKQSAAGARYFVGPISDVSVGCPGTGDISDAVDRGRDYVYQEFEGCDHGNGVGLARSTDGGVSYTPPVALPAGILGWRWHPTAPCTPRS
jgi:hypothetical protein